MSIRARKTAKGETIWWVCTSYGGRRQHWERVGKVKREAELLDKKRKREVEDGTFAPGKATPRTSVSTWCSRWADERTNKTAVEDQRAIRYVLEIEWFASKRLGDLTVHDSMRVVKELQTRFPNLKYLHNIWGSLRTCMRDAYLAELTNRNVGELPRGFLPSRPLSPRGYLEVQEVDAILARPVIGIDRLVFFAIQFFTGARQGEVAGLRWSDWDRNTTPLSALTIERQWNGEALKTEKPRLAPVHPELALLLGWWRETGWELFVMRKPTAGDRILPAMDPRRQRAGGGHTHKTVEYSWDRTLQLLGIPRRVNHETRHTTITTARRLGVPKDILAMITHNPHGDIIDGYTHGQWEPLCGAIARLPFRARVLDSLIDRDCGPSRNQGTGRSLCNGHTDVDNAGAGARSCRFTCDWRSKEVPEPTETWTRTQVLDASPSVCDLRDAYWRVLGRRAA